MPFGLENPQDLPAVQPGSAREHFSDPASTNVALQRAFRGKDDLLSSIPSIAGVLQKILDELNQPADQVNLPHLAELIGRDEAMAAQALRMANSALFARGPGVDSLRGAVRTLGIARIRDIAMSCGLMRVVAKAMRGVDPLVFWRHSLACAIIARKLARSAGFGDPEKAYLAGLLHDIGFIVNLVVLPEQTQAAIAKARRESVFAGEMEYAELGFTHCQSGEVLGRMWNLSDSLIEVILCHHNPAAAAHDAALVAIVALSDRLCRASDLGLGYAEALNPLSSAGNDWRILTEHCPFAAEFTWNEFVKECESYTRDIHDLVAAIYK